MKSSHGNKFVQLVSTILSVLLIAVISGCLAVGPDYVRPDTTVNKDWNTKLKSDSDKKKTDTNNLAAWWNALADPKLSSLIERAEKGNLALKKAQAKIREARARRGGAKASFFPTLNATGSANRSRS